jgi:hypothetical protein
MKKNKEYDVHHIVPRSRKSEGFDIGHEINLKRMRRTLHQRLHNLFNNMTPQEQLELWYDINKAVLNAETRGELQEVILSTKERFYREEVLWEE